MLRPDFTAWFVMQGYIAAVHCLDHVAVEEFHKATLLKPLEIEASKTRVISRLIFKLPYSLQYKLGELLTNTGRIRHFYLRKKEIKRQTIAFLDKESLAQVIILGAGLDMLGTELATSYPQSTFIEIDTKQSQAFKINALAQHHKIKPANFESIQGDLRDSLNEILASSQLFNPHKKTFWIAEGLLMFIPEVSVVRIFTEIKTISASSSCIIFTTLPSVKQTSTINYFIQNFFLKKETCPFQWVIATDSVASFVHRCGLRLLEQKLYSELHKGYALHSGVDGGENIHICSIE